MKHLILGFILLYSMGILKAQDSLSITDIEKSRSSKFTRLAEGNC